MHSKIFRALYFRSSYYRYNTTKLLIHYSLKHFLCLLKMLAKNRIYYEGMK